MSKCLVHYKYLFKQSYGFDYDNDGMLDVVYDWYCDKYWQEMTSKTSVAIGQSNFLLLKIEYATGANTNENYDYLSSVILNFNIPSSPLYSLYMHQLDNWSDNKTAKDLLDILKLPNESDEGWISFNNSITLGGSGDPIPAGCVYIVLSGGLYTAANNYYQSDTGLEISYNETFEYPSSSVNLSIVDNYNNTFTLDSITHNFPSDASIVVYYHGDTTFFPIEVGEKILLDTKDNTIGQNKIQVHLRAQVIYSGFEYNDQIFDFYPEINHYLVPTFIQKPILQHVHNNSNVITEPQLNAEWRYLWDVRAANEISKVCGFVIRLYQNNNAMYLTAEETISYHDYLVWDFEKGLCYIDGTKSNGGYSIRGTSGRFGVDETFELDGKNYGSFYFYPAEMDTEEYLNAENLKIGDKIKISVQPYTRYGENNDGDILLGEEVFSDEYTIGLTHKNTIKIKTSENTFETGEVLIKTAEGWKAALEVSIKTAEGWKASIE